MGSPGLRRQRDRLACRECRRRKLRCDRNTPCDSCVRRRDGASCSYQPFTHTSQLELERRTHTDTRLGHLEQLVQQLAAQQRTNASTRPAEATASAIPTEDPSAQHCLERIHGTSGPEDVVYIGATHWSAMLEDTQTLRSTISSSENDKTDVEVAEPRAEADVSVIFGVGISRALSLNEVVHSYLPSRKDADRLVSKYFRARSIAALFIHTSQFQRQYQAFWNSPGETSPLWTSILFSILHVATNILNVRRGAERVDNRFTIAAAQCLALGEYFRPKSFAVEALLLYAQSQFVTSLELPPDIGSVFGILVRLATTMGYHKDPKGVGFSPFEKEMRRRTWSVCMQLDLLTSFHLGLPSGIQFSTWDTQAPSNLLDSDFDEDTGELPPPRPDNELVGIPFHITKHKFMVVFEKILRHVLTARMHMATDDEAISLDAEIKNVYACLPEMLQPRPIADSVVDPPNLIVTRLCVSFIYHKCLCVLHRLYVTRMRVDSIQECYAAASALVRDFADAYEECGAGGQLETDQWFIMSIAWHDLLLGATALCMVLSAISQGIQGPQINRRETLALLERARVICAERARGRHNETSRVLSIINTTMHHFGEQSVVELAPLVANAPVSPINTFEAGRLEVDRSRNGGTISTLDGPNWAYLDQFLDFASNEAFDHLLGV